MNRGHSWLGSLALVGLLAACGGATNPNASGVVTGVATPYVSLAGTNGQIAEIPVRVTIAKNSTTIAHQTIRGSHTYRFSLAPERYNVTSSGLGSGHLVTVKVNVGQVVRANLCSACQ